MIDQHVPLTLGQEMPTAANDVTDRSHLLRIRCHSPQSIAISMVSAISTILNSNANLYSIFFSAFFIRAKHLGVNLFHIDQVGVVDITLAFP